MTDDSRKPIWFDELEQLRNEVKQLKAEVERLREENARLREQLMDTAR